MPCRSPSSKERSSSMGPKPKPMTGLVFGSLTVVNRASNSVNGHVRYLCRCSCGIARVVDGSALRTGRSQSCGCKKGEVISRKVKKHGMRNTTEYFIWTTMKARCYNKHHKHFAEYGGRGIVMCDRWRDSFEEFYRDMGPRPSPKLSIERLRNHLGYYPGNCKWGTKTEQSRNRRNVVLTLHLAREVQRVRVRGGNVAEWARLHGIKYATAQRAASGKSWKDPSLNQRSN